MADKRWNLAELVELEILEAWVRRVDRYFLEVELVGFGDSSNGNRAWGVLQKKPVSVIQIIYLAYREAYLTGIELSECHNLSSGH